MVSGADLDHNLATAERLLAEAAAAGAQVVGLPEYFPLFGAEDAITLATGEEFDASLGKGKIQSWIRDMARRHHLWLLAGSIPLKASAGRVFNTTLVADPAGKLRARYDKIHLFSFASPSESYDEAKLICPGEQTVALDSPWGRVGLGICYDLRFPEQFRALLAAAPLDLIFLPAAFTVATGRAHWEVLLRARAIENQCYVLAAGQGGRHDNGRRTYGHSLIIDPWGEVLACLAAGEGVITAELDFHKIRRVRQSLPTLTHNRAIHAKQASPAA
jgi:nitrilase